MVIVIVVIEWLLKCASSQRAFLGSAEEDLSLSRSQECLVRAYRESPLDPAARVGRGLIQVRLSCGACASDPISVGR